MKAEKLNPAHPSEKEVLQELEKSFILQKVTKQTGRSEFTVFLGEERETGIKRFFKLGPPEKVTRELTGYQTLSPYLPFPETCQVFPNCLSVEFIQGKTLHEAIKKAIYPPEVPLSIYRNFCQRTENLWLATLSSYQKEDLYYDHKQETRKTLVQIKEALVREKALPIDYQLIVNDEIYPPLKNTINEAMNSLENPPFSVLDPGDANPQNILITNEHEWKIIDLEKSGRYDPAYIISRQIGTWALYVRSTKAALPKIRILPEKKTFFIDYLASRIPIADESTNLIFELGGKFAEKVDDTNWQKRLAYYQLMFFLRFATIKTSWLYRFIKNRFAPSFIGEGVKTFYKFRYE